METKKRNLIILCLIFGMLLTNLVSAAQIGISPAQINFKNVLRGGYAERTVIISTDSEQELSVKLGVRGDITEWLNFSKTEFEISKDNPYILIISASPPSDTPNGNYTAYVRIESNQKSNTAAEGKATSTIIPVIDLFTNVEVTDQEYFECKALKYRVNSTEKGEYIVFTAEIENLGNVKINPQIKIDIWDSEQIEILDFQTFYGDTIKPTTKKTLQFKMDSTNLEIGQYWAEISSIDCYSSQILTFDVLEEGALRANGVLKKILTKLWVSTKETTTIEALFENTGEKKVEAKFKGKIVYGGKIIQILESEKIEVPVNEENTFQFYFTPKKAGRYIVSGRVFYDNKRTFEKSTVINVKKAGINFKSVLKNLLYLGLFLGISFLLYKIRKERLNYQNKLRGLKK